ncbi:hypothetical protein [Haloparvum sp. PAK95]|uniref:hypothetical protein n=1 Tax=Haloparvum sp. PAK95 TaxID=3418962 RepID=UPI003D2EB988
MIGPFSLTFLLQGVALLTGITAGAALGYLLYKDVFVVGYPRFFRIIVVGMFIFAFSGLLIGLFLPRGIHGVHAVSAFVMAVGLYDLLVGEQQSAPVEAAFSDFGEDASVDDFEEAFGAELDAEEAEQ